jgi:predicted phosphodiesterase
MPSIRIAVVSDLHCYYNNTGNEWNIKSYLTTNKSRNPSKNHPVQALLELIENDSSISADYLFCPGDITNEADDQGFITGWEFVRELAEGFKVLPENVFATIGNHDVNSRNAGKLNIFEFAKGIKKGFPLISNLASLEFFSKGYTFVELDDLRILILNTVLFHASKAEIKRGKLDLTQINEIEKYIIDHNDNKIKIVLSHHHPIPHERFGLGLDDVIVNGSNLIEILNQNHFDLFIHGHKHDPWLRYAPGSGKVIPVFSAGSFSATTNHILTGKRNTFHIVNLIKDDILNSHGTIKTWEYMPTIGWKEADSGEDCFPVYSGFGYKGNLSDLVNKTSTLVNAESEWLNWTDFIAHLPEVQFLTPDECLQFKTALKDEFNIITHPELPKKPQLIGKLHV